MSEASRSGFGRLPEFQLPTKRTLSDKVAMEWLNEAWNQALVSASNELDPEMDALCKSSLVSIRYALLTQLLGKHADHSRDALCLQRGDAEGAAEAGRWDPRGFCTAVVVPWVQATDNVLGTSPDPYVNKPLRRKRMDDWSVALRSRESWEQLVTLLSDVEEHDDPAYTEATLRRCLLGITRRYAELNIAYAVPNRISSDQCESVFAQFVAQASGGEAPLIAATALFRIIGRRFGLFDEVSRQRINEADTATGAPGDIQCFQGSPPRVVLSVEVKDRELTLLDLNTSIAKARQAGVTELLFAAPSVVAADIKSADDRVRDEWAQGTNVYRLSLTELLHVVVALAGENARVALMREIGEEINSTATQPSLRTRWASILETIAP